MNVDLLDSVTNQDNQKQSEIERVEHFKKSA